MTESFLEVKLLITWLFLTLLCLFLKININKSGIVRKLQTSDKTFIQYSPDPPPKLHLFLNGTVMIYKAFQDVRYNKVRILGAIYLEVPTSSIIIKVNGKEIDFKREVYGLVVSFNNQFPLKYVNFVFPYIPINKLTVNDEEIEYIPTEKISYKHDFTVCITSIKNRFTAKTMVDQTLNIYQKEGVSHAIIYYGDISKEVYDVLEKHVKNGFLEIYYWPQLEILSYIRNYGQILKMNDCLYRSYFHSRYIINSDIDEIIMPKTFYTLKDLIKKYSKTWFRTYGMFLFWNKYFRKNNKTDNTNKKGRDAYFRLPPIDDCDLFSKTLACDETDKGKYIISTEKVIALRFHDAITTDNKCRISKKDGHVRHTRVILHSHSSSYCKYLKKDETILKYKY